MADLYYIGLELGEKEVRLCVYNRITNEADTVMVKAGGSRAESPAHMAYFEEEKQWKYGIEADYFASQAGCALFDNILDHCNSGAGFSDDGRTYACEVVVGELIRGAVAYAGVKQPAKQIRTLIITVPHISKSLARVMDAAFKYIGLGEGQVYLQSFDESFYSHTFFQKPEVFSRDVGLFCFTGDEVQYCRLHLDQRTRPAIVTVGDNAYEILSKNEEERDRQFEAFINENTAKSEFSSFFLVGSGFDRKWAKNSLLLLCRAGRKVFYGSNLFAKGACYAAYEKSHPLRLRHMLFLGKDLVRKNIGIELRAEGIAMYYPLITAGVNWFDAENSCDIILDDTDSIVFRTSRLEDGKRISYAMPLPGLPKRPPKATRLHIDIKFENANRCVVRVEDMGFGDIFPSSGRTWTDTL